MIKRLSLLILFLISIFNAFSQTQSTEEGFTRADSLRGMLSPPRTCYDINYYNLDIRVDIDTRSISGSNLFRFTATRDFSQLQFDLFDNFEIEKIEYKNQSLKYRTEYDAVFVEFPETIKKGTKADFKVYYSGSPIIAKRAPWDGGFVFGQDSNQAPWVAVACQGLGASSWWPNKDHQADEVDSMLISVTVPRGLQNVSNGRLRSKVVQPDGSTKFNWFVSYPINNYNVTLNIGDFVHFSDKYPGENGELSLDYYVLRENLEKAKEHFKDVKPMLTCFESWFGPYPFYRDGYKLIEAPYLGMEHQSAVAYGNKYQKGYAGADLSGTGWGLKWDYLIIHESGHEWFGNNITSKDIADMWIHEAFTTYSESLFVECNWGKEAAIQYLKGERKNIRNDKPLIGPYNVNKEGSGDMYFKGANLLHTVRSIIADDSLWKSILTGLNTEYGLKTVTTNDIVAYINKRAKKDLTGVFNQYLKYRSIPELVINRKGKGIFTYKWNADAVSFNMPVRIEIPGENQWRFIYPTTEWKTLKSSRHGDIKVDTDNFYIITSLK
ncbi:M1 family metallopeptidase [Desertivirga arenae]|uniref:M1 family metallopeptidase n=1 Tax=Desertivirga arenae TaxID=2810309 RepID=UPI001A96F5D9|nr:M1 family metallopeptidase [Pedobacter sp. SYSU D00823]